MLFQNGEEDAVSVFRMRVALPHLQQIETNKIKTFIPSEHIAFSAIVRKKRLYER